MPARTLALALAAALAGAPAARAEADNPLVPGETWEMLRGDIVGTDAPVAEAGGLYALEAPFRAHDAATVPIRFTQAEGAPDVRRLTLVVDENPAPVAAEFEFGEAMAPLDIEMRVRVDSYSNVRAIVETADGERYMIGRFVRAAGGCSAPATTDAAEAMASLGRMKVRWFDEAPARSGVRREAQVMLRHPNYSGLQRDQLSLLFIPAHFIDTLEVSQGDDLLFRMTGGISISEDPSFRFAYTDNGAGDLRVRATDTEGGIFADRFLAGM